VSQQPYRDSDRRVIPWLLLGLLLAAAAAYAALHLWTADRLPRGTTVDGIAVGGLRPAAAEEKLRVGLDGQAAEPLRVEADGVAATIRPAAAGFTVDVAATVERARRAPSWQPSDLWEWLAGHPRLDADVTVDRARLRRAVGSFAAEVDQPAVEGGVRFAHGEASARYPERGTLLDRPASAAIIRSAFLHDDGPDQVLLLPTRVDQPAITKAAVSRAMDGFANPATSAAVLLRVGRRVVVLQPEDFTRALSMRPVAARLVPRLDERRLLAVVRPRLRRFDRPARDATVTQGPGGPEVRPARAGVRVAPRQVVAGFLAALTSDDRTLRLTRQPVPPELTTAAARRAARRCGTGCTPRPGARAPEVPQVGATVAVDGVPGLAFSPAVHDRHLRRLS
jgi:hypothetical protein